MKTWKIYLEIKNQFGRRENKFACAQRKTEMWPSTGVFTSR